SGIALSRKHLQPEFDRAVSPRSDAARSRFRIGYSQAQPSSTQVGNFAEDQAAEYLQAKGHVIVARNWRSKYCEIDIISTKDGKLYFTEVKYRKTNIWGDGVAAITPRRLSKMKFAVEF